MSYIPKLTDYYKTPEGVVSMSFSHMKQRCKKRNRVLGFTKKELLLWCRRSEDFGIAYSLWIKSGYETNLKPSIDRIDSQKGYHLDNIQVTSWIFNKSKGHVENGTVMGLAIDAYSLLGDHIGSFRSICQASKILKVPRSGIGKVLSGKFKQSNGYLFKYKQ